MATPVVVWAIGTAHEGAVTEQDYISTGAQANDRAGWQAVPGLTFAAPTMHGPIGVSAELTQGNAMFRVQTTNLIGTSTSTVAEPGAVGFFAQGDGTIVITA